MLGEVLSGEGGVGVMLPVALRCDDDKKDIGTLTTSCLLLHSLRAEGGWEKRKHPPSSGVAMATDPESVQCFSTSVAAVPPSLSALLLLLLSAGLGLRLPSCLLRNQTHNPDSCPLPPHAPPTSCPTLVRDRYPGEYTVARIRPPPPPLPTSPPSNLPHSSPPRFLWNIHKAEFGSCRLSGRCRSHPAYL